MRFSNIGLPTLVAGVLFSGAAMSQTPELTVYAGDYFASEWGPGPGIEAAFEPICGCDVVYKTGDLLPRLILEGERTEADVVIGLTTDVMVRAHETGLFAPHGQDLSALTLPVDWTDETFLPFNYGHTAFVYDDTRLANPPESFDDLLAMDDEVKIVIQDPRTSISGLALVLWVDAVYGEKAGEAWEAMAPKILTVTKGWSEAYGLFTDGEADMVLSYTTSPAYHIIAEDDTTKHAAIFPEGHYFMAETVGRIAGSDQPELSQQFMDFVMTREFQEMIPTTNWSLPSALPREDWPAGFADLPLPDKVLYYPQDVAEAKKDAAIETWRQALSR